MWRDNHGMRPVFRFDTNSPYAYLAATRVNAILGPDIEWRPIALAFLLRAQDRRPWSFDEPTRSEGVAECEARTAARGLPPLRWPPGFPVGSYSLEPLRAIAAAIAHEREQALARVLFQRNFVAGEGLRTAGAVRECWVEVGLDSASYDTEIAAAKPVLAAETDRAITEGVYGVPTVTVGDTHFWGDDQLEAAAHAAGSA